MNPNKLVRQLESLTHDERMRRMIEVGRRIATDSSTTAILDSLEFGGFYERLLALQSCYGSGDSARVLRALNDPSRTIRTRAIALLALLGDDSQILTALDTLPFKLRRSLLRSLLKRRRRAIVDTFLDRLASENDEQLTRLLPFGSPEVANRHLDRLLDRGGIDDWIRLARLHPAIAARVVLRQTEGETTSDRQLIWRAYTMLGYLAESDPEQAIAVFRTLARHISLAQLNLQRLAERDPNSVAEAVLNSDDRAQVSFNRVAHKLDLQQLIALLDRQGYTLSSVQIWLKKLFPEARAVVYAHCGNGWRDSEGKLTHAIVALLPRTLREREGRHHLALPALATRPSQRLPYAAFLPWEEAKTTLEPFIQNPDPDLRIAAIDALVFALRYHRDRVSELLSMILFRRNEQDPVRCAMLTGLADLPPSIWREEHLRDLGQVMTDALNAADLSYGTARAAERTIVALLPFHPDWAAKWLAKLVQERGQVSFYNLGDRLSDREMRRIAPILLPVLKSWETRDREIHIIAAAQSIGQRLRVFDELVDILERIVYNTPNSWNASSALNLIAQYRRDRIPALVPKLIKQDPSWVTQSVVYEYLHRSRQDLITPFLGQKAYSGRFSTGKTRFVLPLCDGFYRWTPTQQTMFAQTLEALTRDEKRDFPAVRFAIAQLAALPAISHTRLIELASVVNPKLAVRDTALRALSRLDAGQGVSTLLSALDDDRARIAIYALRRCLLEMPVNRAVQLLQNVAIAKVTVAKEVVRLLGEFPSEEAYRELLRMCDLDLHRDVRVALLRALWSHLDREETWQILEEAAVCEDSAIATMVVRIPCDRLSPTAECRLVSLLATLLTHPDPLVRVDVLQRCVQWPVSDSERILLPKLLEGMSSSVPDERSAAIDAVFTVYNGENAELVGLTVKQIAGNRRSLATTIRALQTQLTRQRGELLPIARSVLEALAEDTIAVSLRVELATYVLPWPELAALLRQLVESGQMHPEALVAAVEGLNRAASRSDVADLAQLEAEFSNSNDDRLRRLALAALVAQSRSPQGWNEERLARLRSYRNDPSPLVAAAAQFTFPPQE